MELSCRWKWRRRKTSAPRSASPSQIPLSACAWDPRFRGEGDGARFRAFVIDVKRLRDLNPDNFCGVDVYNGLLIRFIKRSEAYLSQSEDSVVVDFKYYHAADPSSARLKGGGAAGVRQARGAAALAQEQKSTAEMSSPGAERCVSIIVD